MSDADCTPGREPRSVAASFTLTLTKKLQLMGYFVPQTLYQGCAPRPRWQTSFPKTHCCVPQPWRQIDTYVLQWYETTRVVQHVDYNTRLWPSESAH